jgi:hypothetical protein
MKEFKIIKKWYMPNPLTCNFPSNILACLPMSLTEIEAALPSLSPAERATLQEALYALEEGVSVEEWREINVAIVEAFNDPSPSVTSEEVFARLKAEYDRP